MSVSGSRREAERWLAMAADDLVAARVLSAGEMFAHACFAAQQCGEKAVKALFYLHGEDPWGHSVQKLISDFPIAKEADMLRTVLDKAMRLDRFYIPTRYPNGLPDLTPGEAYGQTDADQALADARCLLEMVRSRF